MRGLPFAFWKKSAIIYDVDALEFIENWETNTNTTMLLRQRLAVNDWYRGMKGEGTPNGSNLWALAILTNARIFPLIPLTDSTANALAYSLDAVSGGVIKGNYINMTAGSFTAQGVIGGSNRYFNSEVSPSFYNINSSSYGIYSRTNISGSLFDLGASDGSTVNAYLLNSRNPSDLLNFVIANNVSQSPPPNNDSRGLHLMQNNNTNKQGVKNGIILNTVVQNLTGQTVRNLYFHAWNSNGSIAFPSTRQLCYYQAGLPNLTTDENIDLYTVVQRLQSNVIAGGRQIGTAIPPI